VKKVLDQSIFAHNIELQTIKIFIEIECKDDF